MRSLGTARCPGRRCAGSCGVKNTTSARASPIARAAKQVPDHCSIVLRFAGGGTSKLGCSSCSAQPRGVRNDVAGTALLRRTAPANQPAIAAGLPALSQALEAASELRYLPPSVHRAVFLIISRARALAVSRALSESRARAVDNLLARSTRW